MTNEEKFDAIFLWMQQLRSGTVEDRERCQREIDAMYESTIPMPEIDLGSEEEYEVVRDRRINLN